MHILEFHSLALSLLKIRVFQTKASSKLKFLIQEEEVLVQTLTKKCINCYFLAYHSVRLCSGTLRKETL